MGRGRRQLTWCGNSEETGVVFGAEEGWEVRWRLFDKRGRRQSRAASILAW